MLNALAGERMNALYPDDLWRGVPYHLYVTKDMTVTKPEDIKGLRFRGQPNYAAVFKHFGCCGRKYRAA